MRARLSAVLAFLILAVLMAGRAGAAEETTVEIATKSGVRVFAIELAVTDEERAKGLMYRKELPDGRGMLFDFRTEQDVSMWMKNTLIPLDMLFVDQQGRVINIHERAVPGSLDPIAAAGPARAVIELNGGTAAHLGIKPGDRVIYPMFGNAS